MQSGREIKFRYVFKHPKTKEVQTAIITIDDMERNDWSKTFKWDSLRFELVARQRYTGLRDKNGKEIYEGDIVDLRDHPFEGPMKINGVYEVGYNERMELCCGSLLLHREIPYITVIGNIYENRDLLEVGK